MDWYLGRHCIVNRARFASLNVYRESRSVEVILGRWQFVASITTTRK